MPRMQVYLPDELYDLVKSRKMPASELLQKAIREEARRQDLLLETARYLAELVDEVGPVPKNERDQARRIAERITRRGRQKAS